MDTRKQVEVHGEASALARTGQIYSYTVVQEPPEGFEDQTPYVVALIKLDDGTLITAQLTDLDAETSINIGDPVEMVTRKLTTEGARGMIIYGYKFRRLLRA
jgi:hypothetical protein